MEALQYSPPNVKLNYYGLESILDSTGVSIHKKNAGLLQFSSFPQALIGAWLGVWIMEPVLDNSSSGSLALALLRYKRSNNPRYRGT